MKRILLLMLSVIVSTMMMADDVTPQQALEQASQFVKSRKARGGGPRLAPGTQPKLALASRVSDLYVFNINGDAGYVIVSNDDVAVPILGYSDSGSFDPNNIPDNMRAWLQGYADEIAWAKANHVTKPLVSPKAPSLTASSVKSAIAPLMITLWNQDEPYNNLCPEYASGYRSATGCVATAMAQAMYYTEKKAGNSTTETTKVIPAYTSDSYEFSMPEIEEGSVLSWNKMLPSYSGSYETDQATAVATLMLYCGTSVEMDYGPSSGTNTALVAAALKNYFDYSETTTYLDRSFYSYAKWIEIIYNELNQKRVVVYSGQSSGGGHAFICDGYETEDYFHINWGWGGQSDDYFKLSALDPESQGIGGSSSSDGFHFGQGAVVGIQKTGGSGTVLNIPVNNYHLALNSVTVSKSSISLGESVDVTFNITNNGSEAYDGDVWVCLYGAGLMVGKTFIIGAGETKDCVVSYTPQHTGTLYLDCMVPSGGGYYAYLNDQIYATLSVSGSPIETTDNIDLTLTGVHVENYEISGSDVNVYGSTLKGTLTVLNPEEDKNYSSYYEWALLNDNRTKMLAYSSSLITIPAKESIDIPFEINDLEYDKNYWIAVTYVKNNAWTDWSYLVKFTVKPAVITYAVDGTKTVTKPSATFEVPNGVYSVDLTGTGVTAVTANSEVNCLYFLGTGDEVPSGLTNVVRYNSATDTYTASNITLTDGNGFYSPIDFTAANIEFVYNNSKQADGTNGWNSLMLPFNVTSVTADDAPIDWFHSGTDTGKQFWVKKFISDEANQVYFDYAEEMAANTPYIVALPGNHWGAAYDLSGKVIKFIGENVTVSKSDAMTSVTGSNYRFVGSTVQDNTTNIYCLNAAGNAFALTNGSAPFRAYFKPGTFDYTITSLAIGNGTGGATGIQGLGRETITDNIYYDLQGRRVEHPTKGVYVVNGKKVVIK